MRRLKVTVEAIVVSAAMLWGRPALAISDGDKEAVRTLANEAAADFESSRYELAFEKFQRAYRAARVPKLAVWLARTAARLGRLVAAHEYYREALSLEPTGLWMGSVQQKAQQEAASELNLLKPRIPRLTIEVEGAKVTDVSISIDGEEVPTALIGVERLTDPGDHEIVGRRGQDTVREVISLGERARRKFAARFAPRDDEPSNGMRAPSAKSASADPLAKAHAAVRTSPQRQWGWASLGLGAVGVTVGATAGIVVAMKYNTLRDECGGQTCSKTQSETVSTYDSWQTVATMGFVVGGIAAAAGTVLVLTSPRAKASPRAEIRFLPGWTGVGGVF